MSLSHTRPAVRYTFKIVKIIVSAILFVVLTVACLAEDQTFSRLKLPTPNGKQAPATLTFSDTQKTVTVKPIKGGNDIAIPYGDIDKCTYQYTKKHRITQGLDVSAVGLVPVGIVLMFTKYKSHWLEIDYHQQQARKWVVVRMDKKNYPRILDALRDHTGIDAEVLGNVDKRSK